MKGKHLLGHGISVNAKPSAKEGQEVLNTQLGSMT
jgi:hypothetical protein